MTCPECKWSFWVDPLDKRLPDQTILCGSCSGEGEVIAKAKDDGEEEPPIEA